MQESQNLSKGVIRTDRQASSFRVEVLVGRVGGLNKVYGALPHSEKLHGELYRMIVAKSGHFLLLRLCSQEVKKAGQVIYNILVLVDTREVSHLMNILGSLKLADVGVKALNFPV
jgi:hypothetical protein